jgi:hypothetical protein
LRKKIKFSFWNFGNCGGGGRLRSLRDFALFDDTLSGSVVIWIWIGHFKWIRIWIRDFDGQILNKKTAEKISKCNFLIPRPP